jgi:thiol-disulfide isomerase/thioredoxin
MSRFLLCFAPQLLLTVAAPAFCLDEPTPSLAAQIASVSKENDDLEQWFRAELTAAKRDHDMVVKANQDYWNFKKPLTEKLKTLIKENPDKPEVFEAAMILVSRVRSYLDEHETRIVLDHHLAHPAMGQFCFQLRYRAGERWAQQILEAAAEKHPSNDVRGQAVFALADNYRSAALPHHTREVSEEQKAAHLTKAAKLYEQTTDQYAKIPTPDGKTTLGEKARHELTLIKNLPNLAVGRPAPPIVGEDLDGKPLRLEDYRGKVVLLVFWGSWCGPCMAMVPHERELFERHKGKPFALLGVNCGDPLDKAQATVQEKQMSWSHWYDTDEIRGPIQTHYNVPHWPRTFLIDNTGLIRAIDPEAKDLDELIEKLLDKI